MRPPELRIGFDEMIVDSFAGGGGASLGIEWALGRSPDIAINHDAEAIAVHEANHPSTRHFCEDIWKVDPRLVCKTRPALLWASPDCKHFSKAKGGKPVDKRIRGLAWNILVWLKTVKPRVFALENVEEFEDWGPLNADGLPDVTRLGLTFSIWIGKIRALGYKVETRQIVAADHGTPTTRKRLFVVGRCDGQPIVWPAGSDTFRVEERRVAADCLDWSLPTYSIFLSAAEARRHGVRRPLAENTMRRIARGLQKFVIDNPEPFLIGAGGPSYSGKPVVVGRPFGALTTENHRAVVAPFLTEHANGKGRNFSAVDPLRTQCAEVKGGHFALVAPWFVPRYGERDGQAPRARTVEAPMPTIVPSQNGAHLVAAFLAKHFGGHETPGSPLRKTMDTVTARDHHALVASSLVKLKGTCNHGQQLRLPLATVQAGGYHYAETRAFLVKYYGTNDAIPLAEPCRAVTAVDRFGLVTVHGEPYVIADIGMRMLAPRELYRAQGFPDSYVIDPVVEGKPLSKEAQVRCVGNSVCPPVAAAIVRAQFEHQSLTVSEVA